jgi:acyl carrier protein
MATQMTKEEILARVREILAESFELEPDAIRPDAHLIDDLDLDSIDAIDLAVSLEEETGLDVSEDELREIRRVQDVVELIHGRLQSA